MVTFKDSPWTVGIVVCALFVLSACARTPSVPEEGPKSSGVEATSPAQNATLVPAAMGTPTAASVTATSPGEATRVPPQETPSSKPTVPEPGQASPTEPIAQARLPIFVEIVQAPLSPDSPAPVSPADVGPIGVFAFDPSNRVLLVQPSFQILSTTEVLVGLTRASVPGKPYVSSALFQIPSARTAPLTVVATDADTDTVTVTYGEHRFELGPDQSLAFKEKREGELVPMRVTTIINHGRPSALGVLSTGPASR